MICNSCGRDFKGGVFAGGICQTCNKYFKAGGEINAIPPPGVIMKDKRGYVICHICGRSYSRIGSHVRESHSMTIHEYKERFGLCECSKTTEENYSNMMSAYAYDRNMPERLKAAGMNTRIKSGERDKRHGKKIRLQESINKKNRKKAV